MRGVRFIAFSRPALPSEGWEEGVQPWGGGALLAASVVHTVIIGNLTSLCFSTCSVFWDLYCAAPERRDTCEHSSEAKAFHDYVSNKILIPAIITGLDSSSCFRTKRKYTAVWHWVLFSSCLSSLPTSLLPSPRALLQHRSSLVTGIS